MIRGFRDQIHTVDGEGHLTLMGFADDEDFGPLSPHFPPPAASNLSGLWVSIVMNFPQEEHVVIDGDFIIIPRYNLYKCSQSSLIDLVDGRLYSMMLYILTFYPVTLYTLEWEPDILYTEEFA
jgi:hypothetical protein